MVLSVTIALVIKVNDGVVLAADSATTMTTRLPDGSVAVGNIYNNANKVFNLHKELPIGAMTWGLGNIGPASIATLTKDMRRLFHGTGADADWKLDPADYDVSYVADQVREFLFTDRYQPLCEGMEPAEPPPVLGFLTVGYSSDSDQPQIFVMNLGEPEGDQATEVLEDDTGAMWWGQPEAISRIVTGMSLDVPQALLNLDIGLTDEQAFGITNSVRSQIMPQLVPPAMPIQDAIDLAEFLVYATIQYVRFCPGHATVGGPIEIATITKHEGFKWVTRKHYYDAQLNPQQEAR